jgi:hypothetical protein
MFQLDDKFLQDLGLDQLPPEQKQAFLAHIYSELELRVGTRLSDGLTDEQMTEFESFVDRDSEKVYAWVAANTPDYQNDPSYAQMKASAQQAAAAVDHPQDVDELSILAEYASLKWLSINRPDYRQVVAQVLEELKKEIMNNREAIVGPTDQPA